jgi:geranylgeranyl reductase family protein
VRRALASEVIVVGAGPAGSATAFHLARAGVETLLIDKSPFPRDKVCGDCLSPRAQDALARMGMLAPVAAEAQRAERIRFRSPGGAEAAAAIKGDGVLPNSTLVLPRQRFDHLLQQHALAAGVRFRVGHVRRLVAAGGGVEIDGAQLPARVVVVATGATLSLSKRTPLASGGAVHSVAARCYVRGLNGLGPDLRLFFDRMPLPGYAWLFPAGPDSANLGYWYSGRDRLSATAVLGRLLVEHPDLSTLIAGASATGAPVGYPIRSDFLRAPVVAPGLLAVGEAAGLVNPFTGEGIDYALESAELASEAIVAALRGARGSGPLPLSSLSLYRRALSRRFRALFALMQLAQRHASTPWVFDRLFGRGVRGQRLVDRLVQVCFGAAPPHRLLDPVELLRLALSRPDLDST